MLIYGLKIQFHNTNVGNFHKDAGHPIELEVMCIYIITFFFHKLNLVIPIQRQQQ